MHLSKVCLQCNIISVCIRSKPHAPATYSYSVFSSSAEGLHFSVISGTCRWSEQLLRL